MLCGGTTRGTLGAQHREGEGHALLPPVLVNLRGFKQWRDGELLLHGVSTRSTRGGGSLASQAGQEDKVHRFCCFPAAAAPSRQHQKHSSAALLSCAALRLRSAATKPLGSGN